MSDDNELEEAFRAGLQRRAEDADTSVDLLGPARSGARGRRRRTWLAGTAGLAAAALVTAVVVQNTRGPDGPDGAQVVDAGTSEPLPTEWRIEAWHGVQIEVPADWAWGAGPADSGGDLFRCGGPDGAEPYVGRPVSSSDMCQGVDEESTPLADYVWFDAPTLEGGDLGDGYFRAEVGIGETTVTIATDDQALGLRIQGSLRPVEGCAGSLPSAPVVDSMLTEGLRNPSSAQVCAYRKDQGESAYELVYATTLTQEQASTYHSQVYDGGRESAPDFCDDALDERVLITVTGEDPYGSSEVSQATVVDPSCREVSGSPGMVSPLSDQGMAAWSSNGAAVTLYGLIGPMG